MKKIISLLMALSMMISAVPSFASENNDAVKEENSVEINAIEEIKIMDNIIDDNVKLDEPFTRAEAAMMVIKLINNDKGITGTETEFIDVPKEHKASGYIMKAMELGIVNGHGDKTFTPDENVTFHQMVKMLVCALGYEPFATANGGWKASGYIFAASKIGLTKSVTGSSTEYITKEKAMKLIQNALSIELMGEINPSEEIKGKTYGVLKGETILTRYWNIK